MDTTNRLQAFVGKQASAHGIEKATVIAVKPSQMQIDDIEHAINWSDFTLRLDGGGTVTLSGMWLDTLDHNNYLEPADCPWMILT
jgi:hypothetical protein